MFPSMLNCVIEKSEYLKNPNNPKLPARPTTNSDFFLRGELALKIALPM